TLLLDEVADLSPATQAKLLRVLQDGEFQRVGGTGTLRVDVRILSATNRDLEGAVAAGRFREDLYFRLNVIRIELPPLRERPEDLLALADHFLAHFAAEVGRAIRGFSPAARQRILLHPWPGNVRELRNAVERAVLLAEGGEVGPSDLFPGLRGGGELLGGWRPVLPPGGISFEEAERGILLAALERTGFVQKDAAALLRISRRRLNYMVRRLGIRHPSWRRNRGPGPGGEGAPTSYPLGDPGNPVRGLSPREETE
ncbi:MAG: sigma-54-dependent Fis family transcriptional regulator, partial [Nitrospirae bacterium]